jgi:hypothetical protein
VWGQRVIGHGDMELRVRAEKSTNWKGLKGTIEQEFFASVLWTYSLWAQLLQLREMISVFCIHADIRKRLSSAVSLTVLIHIFVQVRLLI